MEPKKYKYTKDTCPKHDYEEVSSRSDFDGETYVCKRCGDRYRLYYGDMA